MRQQSSKVRCYKLRRGSTSHLRLHELAIELGIDIVSLPSFAAALATGVCRSDGLVIKRSSAGSFIYAGSERAALLRYMLEILRAVLAEAPLRNISDYLDRGVLKCIVPGDVVFVQGLHTFTQQDPAPAGSQLSRGRRSANRVVVSFVFDLGEATSVSAWSTWLRGRGSVGCLLRIQRLSRRGSKLHIECTVLAIRSAYHALKQRVYELSLLGSGLPASSEDDSEAE